MNLLIQYSACVLLVFGFANFANGNSSRRVKDVAQFKSACIKSFWDYSRYPAHSLHIFIASPRKSHFLS